MAHMRYNPSITSTLLPQLAGLWRPSNGPVPRAVPPVSCHSAVDGSLLQAGPRGGRDHAGVRPRPRQSTQQGSACVDGEDEYGHAGWKVESCWWVIHLYYRLFVYYMYLTASYSRLDHLIIQFTINYYSFSPINVIVWKYLGIYLFLRIYKKKILYRDVC